MWRGWTGTRREYHGQERVGVHLPQSAGHDVHHQQHLGHEDQHGRLCDYVLKVLLFFIVFATPLVFNFLHIGGLFI